MIPKIHVTPADLAEAEKLSRQAEDLDHQADEDASAGIRFATVAARKRQEATDLRLKALGLFFDSAS